MNIREALYYSSHRLFVGSSIGNVYKQYYREDRQGVPRERTRRLLVNILRHCEQNVPYYADLIAEAGSSYLTDPETYLQRLPILTKGLIRKNFERLTSNDLSQRRWMYNTSGGSTGEPVKFIQDRAFWDRQMAAQMVSFNWAGRAFGEPAMYVWGSTRDILRGSVGLKMKILNTLTNDSYLNAYRMTPDKMRLFIQQINENPPKLIIAYANAFYELTKFVEREQIRVVPQQAILTSAEPLQPFMREKIEAVFGCKVFNQYGSREVGTIASECREHNGLHVLPWGNYVEIVDEDGSPVPEGVEGNILITSLMNYAMPLIRYFIGDRGILLQNAACTCGRGGQMFKNITGRSNDLLRKKDGSMVESGYFEGLLYFKDWVHKFQVVQKTPSLIVFNIVKKGSECPARELEEVAAHSRTVMGADCEIRFEFVDDILPSASGKYRYIISEVQ